MSHSRAAILGRLSSTLGHAAAADAPAVVQRVHERARGPQPEWAEAVRERFLAKLAGVAGTYAEVASRDGIVAAGAAHLAAQLLPQRVCVAPHPVLAGIEWPQGWQAESRRARGDDRAGLAVAFCGIAETGSLVLLSGPDSPTSLNSLPD